MVKADFNTTGRVIFVRFDVMRFYKCPLAPIISSGIKRVFRTFKGWKTEQHHA